MSVHDFAERRQFRERKTVHWFPSPPVPPTPFTDDELRRAGEALDRYVHHTQDSKSFQPSWDQLHDLEAKVEHVRAKYVGMFVLGLALGVCFGYWVLPGWVNHG